MPFLIATHEPDLLLGKLKESLLEWNENRRKFLWRYNEAEGYFQRIGKGTTEARDDVDLEPKFFWKVKQGVLLLTIENEQVSDPIQVEYYNEFFVHLLRKHVEQFSWIRVEFDKDEVDLDVE